MSSGLGRVRALMARLRSGEAGQPAGPAGSPLPQVAPAGLDAPMPRGLPIPPSMMSERERTLLFNLARDVYGGRGVIMDCGIFLGASTCCFGEGLKRNPARTRAVEAWSAPIVSFDLGLMNRTMQSFFARHDLPLLAEGASLEPLIGRNIAEVRSLVDLRIGDITETGAVTAPIEILFLDCLKQEAISGYAIKRYFPQLFPGSIVVQQDYLSDMLPFIKVHQEYFADHFDFVGEWASSAVFRCREEIPSAKLASWRSDLADPNLQIRLVEAAGRRTRDPARQVLVSLSAMRLIGALKGLDAARARLDALKGAHAAYLADAALPRRVRNALHGADMLCASEGKRRDFIDAQLISLGHDISERPGRRSKPKNPRPI